MKTLILITNDYPYGKGEAFLENETPYLANYFDSVHIFSITGSAKLPASRKVPKGVKSYALNMYKGKAKYPYYLSKGLIPNASFRLTGKTLKQLLAELYSRGRAKAVTKRILKIINAKRINVDDVVVYSFWFSYQALAAVMLIDWMISSGKTAVAISRAHGYDLYWERSSINFLPYQDKMLKELKTVFPCSQYGREYLLKRYPWADDKIRVSILGTNDYGLNPYKSEKLFMTCCNLEPLKRITLFAQAFSRIAKENDSVHWICIGDGEEFENIKQIIENEQIQEHVSLLGHLDNMKVMEIYKNIGVYFFCNVSTTEGLPVSIMEAFSFGIPCIATDVGGTKELVVNERTGFLIPQDLSLDSLECVLSDTMKLNTEQYYEMRRQARLQWAKYASANVNYEEFCKTIIR